MMFFFHRCGLFDNGFFFGAERGDYVVEYPLRFGNVFEDGLVIIDDEHEARVDDADIGNVDEFDEFKAYFVVVDYLDGSFVGDEIVDLVGRIMIQKVH